MSKPVSKPKITRIPKVYGWGLYFWQLPDGHLFRNEDNELLNIPAYKGDLRAIKEIKDAAAHYGQPEGRPWFFSGGRRATDEEYSEQLDRLREGYIPSLNDLGAVMDAKEGLEQYGE